MADGEDQWAASDLQETCACSWSRKQGVVADVCRVALALDHPQSSPLDACPDVCVNGPALCSAATRLGSSLSPQSWCPGAFGAPLPSSAGAGSTPLGRRSTGENEKCARFEHLTESFSTECPSLPTMLAVIGQIEVMRCCTARTWVPRKVGRE